MSSYIQLLFYQFWYTPILTAPCSLDKLSKMILIKFNKINKLLPQAFSQEPLPFYLKIVS